MSLAAPVRNPDQPDQELLKRGYILEPNVVERMTALGVDFIYVDYPALDDLDKHLAVQLSPERQAIYTQVKRGIQAMQKQTRAQVGYGDYYSATRDLITTLMGQGQHPIYLDQMSRVSGDAVSHAAAVAHLSLVLGLKLERYVIAQRKRLAPHHAKEIVNLGVAGMLHDIGKTKISSEAACCDETEPPANLQLLDEWRTHPRVGYECVRGGIEASAASAILHHHQHFDGSGFPDIQRSAEAPSRPGGERIHVFARIVLVADLYDRLAKPVTAGRRRSNLEILSMIRRLYAAWCDPNVLQTLECIAPPFIPGSRVTLSDDSHAIVLDVDPDRPYSPIVKRLNPETLELIEPRLDLALTEGLAIKSIGGKSVKGLIPESAQVAAVA
jgi:HD-GYP domain-containing protein (c-di-GMP phosphodiesterase class II)